jgi:anti-sigma factor RsiW
MGEILSFPGDRHQEVQLLLPWYASARLGAEERAIVEAHLAGCAECRAEFNAEQRLRQAVTQLSPDAEQGWEALRAKVSAASAPHRRPRRSWAAAGRAVLRPERLRWVVAAQFVALLMLGALALPSARPAEYRALGDAPAVRSGNALAMFRPETSEAEMRRSLRASGARLIDGPTEADAYVLEVGEPKGLAALRRNPHVTMAEPIEQAPGE